MSDLLTSCKKSYYASNGNHPRRIKLSKWELPISNSKSYWNGVLTEIENKYKRVRDPRFVFPLNCKSSKISTKTLFSDNIKIKISPSESTYKMKKMNIDTKLNKYEKIPFKMKNIATNSKICKNDLQKFKKIYESYKNIKIFPCTSNSVTTNEFKEYLQQHCQCHQNTLSKKLLNNKNYHYLQKTNHSFTFNLLDFFIDHQCDLQKLSFNRKKYPLTYFNDRKNDVKSENLKKNIAKAPKIQKSNLSLSFIKTISHDTSVISEEYFDSQKESFKSKSQSDTNPSIKVKKSDFLSTPNLKSISSQPNFHKVLVVNSFYKEFINLKNKLIDLNTKFLIEQKQIRLAKKNLANKTYLVKKIKKSYEVKKQDKLSTSYDITSNKIRNIFYYEKMYAYRALNYIQKQKYLKKYPQMSTYRSIMSFNNLQTLFRSKYSGKSAMNKPTNINVNRFGEMQKININIIYRILKNMSNKYFADYKKCILNTEAVDKSKSIMIYKSSHNILGVKSSLLSNLLIDRTNNILKDIPKAKLIHRPQIDKCYACLHIPFNCEKKIIHKIPFPTIESNIQKNRDSDSSNSCSSSTSSRINTYMESNLLGSNENFIDSLKIGENIIDNKSQDVNNLTDQVTIPLDKKNLKPFSKSSIQELSRTEQFFSQQLLLDNRSKYFKTLSVDRSKSSASSNHSSESEEIKIQEDKLPRNKISAPCHASVIWRKSFEPLRALKLKQTMSIKERIKNIIKKSCDENESDNYAINIKSSTLSKLKEDEISSRIIEKDPKKLMEKKPKPLMKIKSSIDNTTIFSPSIKMEEIHSKKFLKRAKTTFELTSSGNESDKSLEMEKKNIGYVNESISEYEKSNLGYFDVITKYQSGFKPPPIMSNKDVMNIIKDCLSDGFNATNLMDKLSKEYIKRLENKYNTTENYENKKSLKIGLNLFKTLINSKQLINSNILNGDFKFSQKQSPILNSRKLRRILPEKSYNLVADVLGFSTHYSKSEAEIEESNDVKSVNPNQSTHKNTEIMNSKQTLDLIVNPGTSYISTKTKRSHDPNLNPFALFLKKSRRKAVVWRPLQKEDFIGYDPEATLKMRASRLLNQICKDFCDWINKLGGNIKMIDEQSLQDMFEINFTSDACGATQVLVKEMPTIPTIVVKARNCMDADKLMNTRKQIMKDLKIEKRAKRTFAFGQTLSNELKFIPPRGNITSEWLEFDNYPKDVKSMDVVWEGITHLTSVREFKKFLEKNSEVASIKLLENLKRRPSTKML